jgi:hypothetical protein
MEMAHEGIPATPQNVRVGVVLVSVGSGARYTVTRADANAWRATREGDANVGYEHLIPPYALGDLRVVES